MRSFEVFLNGKKLCVAGLPQGGLHFGLACGENSHGRGGVGLNMTGVLPNFETVRWQHRVVQMNDEVRIKIVEVTRVSKYETMQKAPRDERKYEKRWVRRMAKEFGWTIQAKRPSQKSAVTRRRRTD